MKYNSHLVGSFEQANYKLQDWALEQGCDMCETFYVFCFIPKFCIFSSTENNAKKVYQKHLPNI